MLNNVDFASVWIKRSLNIFNSEKKKYFIFFRTSAFARILVFVHLSVSVQPATAHFLYKSRKCTRKIPSIQINPSTAVEARRIVPTIRHERGLKWHTCET